MSLTVPQKCPRILSIPEDYLQTVQVELFWVIYLDFIIIKRSNVAGQRLNYIGFQCKY